MKEKKFLMFGIFFTITQILSTLGTYLIENKISFSPIIIVLAIINFYIYFKSKKKMKTTNVSATITESDKNSSDVDDYNNNIEDIGNRIILFIIIVLIILITYLITNI